MVVESFTKLLNESIKSFREHFNLIIKVSIFLYFIPNVIIELIQIYYYNIFKTGIKHFLIDIPAGIASGITYFLLIFTIIKIIALKKKKKEITFSEAIKFASEHFLPGLILLIKISFFLFFLYMLFIIPGIIFSIFWVFSFYALINDNVDVKEAMGHSKKVVKGRWFKVFWYVFLPGLIITLLRFSISYFFSLYKGLSLSQYLTMFNNHVPSVTIPVTILFLILDILYVPFLVIFLEKFYVNQLTTCP